jgi:thioredoxin 2
MPRYTGINHLAMVTGDMDATIRFWRDLLGMRLVAGLGSRNYRHYFLEISGHDMIAFFERDPEQGGSMTDERVLIKCRSCGARNRIPVARLNDGPRCGRCKNPFPSIAAPDRPVMVTDRTFADEVLDSPLPVLLDCWASWCAPCGAMAPVLDDLAKGYAGRLKVAKLNVDQNPVTASRYNVMSLPTLLFIRDGKVVDTAAGALPRQEIERYLYRFLAG